MQNTGGTFLFRYERFINFWLRFFDTKRETILKSLTYHTMLTTSFNGRNPTLYPNDRNSTIVFRGPTSKSPLHVRTLTSQHHGRTKLQLSAIEADNPTDCLHGLKSTFNSHVTCTNSSLSLTMVTPTSHFFAFHWSCCLILLATCPSPLLWTEAFATITEFNHVHRSR